MEIKISNLNKSFAKVDALKDVNLKISKGMFGLLGPNGAGKTTLMRILTTIMLPTSGSVRINEYDAVREPEKVRKFIGYLPQEFGIYRNLNPEEFLNYIALLKGIDNRSRRHDEIDNVLNEVNLYDVRRRKIKGFSGGMKQRLGIAQALLDNPPILIVDEPTAGLDPQERMRFRNILTELSRDRIVLLSTHVLADIESCCNDMAVLKKGEIIYSGTIEKLMHEVSDKVWEATMSFEEYDVFKYGKVISATKRQHDGVMVRYISDNEEQNSKNVECNLEDCYVYLMGGVKYNEDI